MLCFIFAGSNNVASQTRKAFQPGGLWPDNNGLHINAHGGGIIFHEDKYYWFGEHKGERSNNALIGVTCYSSTDLYNWQYEGVALLWKMTPQATLHRAHSILEEPLRSVL